ncbi:MAG: hypothetical protein PHE72_14795 [candidate division Zixibacteria bacterium]|nr:hypothetical protein [candidate division Zixibacteria bacterium]
MNFIRQTVLEAILPADVRASNVSSEDFATLPWHGIAKFHLDAEAQGSGKELTVTLQHSDPAEKGAEYAEETSLGDTQLRSGEATNIMLGAQFTQSGTRQVKKIKLTLKRRGTIAALKYVQVKLYSDDTNAPDAELGASGTVLCTAIGTSYAQVEFTFDVPVTLTDAEKYWVVLLGDYDVSGTNNIAWETDTIVSGGNYAHYTSAWQAITATKSLLFEVWEYNFAAITGGAFTKVENVAATEELVLNIDDFKAYMRAVTTGASTNTGAISLILIGTQKYPV